MKDEPRSSFILPPSSPHVLVFGDEDDPLLAEFVATLAGETAASDEWQEKDEHAPAVVFLPWPTDQAVLDAAVEAIRTHRPARVCIVSGFHAHFDARFAGAEARAVERLRGWTERVTVLRPGYVLSPHAPMTVWLRRMSFCAPLVPACLTSCFLPGTELFAALRRELHRPQPRPGGIYTLLGPNRPWCEVLREHRPAGLVNGILTGCAALVSFLLVGRLAVLLLAVLTRWRPALRRWHFNTITPSTPRELLALYNPYNHRHVKIVGYNNGVVHFGQRFPGQTVVSTARVNGRAAVRGSTAQFDAGVTVRRAMDVLAAAGKELPVVPNYSYVCLGTAFFVPIHGSAAACPTLGDALTRVLLYDPVRDKLVAGGRSSSSMRDYMYNLDRPALLLRLRVRVQDRTDYFMQRRRLERPAGRDLLALLQDRAAANVELRKARAADESVDVRTYYTQRPDGAADVLPLPKDAIGRLWDRLEENTVTSLLFHWVVRSFLHHVELFFTGDEFLVFWDTHTALPISKMQLRYIRRDGLPHSPFRDHDCISVDLIMRRKHRAVFDAYLKENFRAVQFNPGKHSR